jgi:hypothetical protein
VHDCVDSRKRPGQRYAVQNVTFQQLTPGGQKFMPRAQIVKNDRFMASVFERANGMTADVTRSAGDQNNHATLLSRA